MAVTKAIQYLLMLENLKETMKERSEELLEALKNHLQMTNLAKIPHHTSGIVLQNI